MFGKLSRKGVWMHVFFVSLFLIVPTLAFVRPPGEPFFALTRVFVQDTTANFVLLCFFYFNYYVLLPRFFFNRKWVLYVLFAVLFLSVSFILPQLIGQAFPDRGKPFPPEGAREPGALHHRISHSHSLVYFVFMEFRRHLYLFFTAIFFSFLLRTRGHLSQLKEEKLHAELTSLKAQINPHFLFNTLNSIYVLSVKKDEKASEAIVHLSGLMRYVIKDAHAGKILLQKEVDYITNYIELQKARLGDTVRIHYTCTGDPGGKEIAPLILITYIENAFKYGVNPDVEDCSLEIRLHTTDTGIQLYTCNQKVQPATQPNSTGIGLKNTGERLKHLYPEKHHVRITETNDRYCVTLSLILL